MEQTSCRPRTALVIGCGIAGPAVAMALQRVGITPVIYEARPALGAQRGAFLTIASNGRDALRALAVDDALLSDAFPTPRMVMWSGRGKRLGEVANGTTLQAGFTSLTVQRGALQTALRDEAERRGIQVLHAKALQSVQSLPQQVIARFADGSEAHADLLVGADGVHARTRQLLDPGCPAPRFSGQLSVGGFAYPPTAPALPGSYHMIFGKRAFFGFVVAPTGTVYWFANLSVGEAPSHTKLSDIDPDTWKQRLAELFADDTGPALALLAHTGTQLSAHAIYDLPRVPVWHRGRMVLVGDAAHATSPSSGQGAALALEDAVLLARCLRDASDPETAFVAYERLRRARVERVVRLAARIGNNKVAGPVARVFRDWMMPWALKMFAGPRAHAWLYEQRLDA